MKCWYEPAKAWTFPYSFRHREPPRSPQLLPCGGPASRAFKRQKGLWAVLKLEATQKRVTLAFPVRISKEKYWKATVQNRKRQGDVLGLCFGSRFKFPFTVLPLARCAANQSWFPHLWMGTARTMSGPTSRSAAAMRPMTAWHPPRWGSLAPSFQGWSPQQKQTGPLIAHYIVLAPEHRRFSHLEVTAIWTFKRALPDSTFFPPYSGHAQIS